MDIDSLLLIASIVAGAVAAVAAVMAVRRQSIRWIRRADADFEALRLIHDATEPTLELARQLAATTAEEPVPLQMKLRNSLNRLLELARERQEDVRSRPVRRALRKLDAARPGFEVLFDMNARVERHREAAQRALPLLEELLKAVRRKT